MGPLLVFRRCSRSSILMEPSSNYFPEWSYVGGWRDGVGIGPLKLGHVAFFVPDPKFIAEFYQRVLGFKISDWIEDFFVFMRCNPDHHSVNFVRGDKVRMHHVAFELKDVAHISNSCDLLARHELPLVWGPLRFGPGHNVAAFHRNQDNQLVEFYAELDQMKDEELGYLDGAPGIAINRNDPKFGVDTTIQTGALHLRTISCKAGTTVRSCPAPRDA